MRKENIMGLITDCQGLILGAIYCLQFKRMSLISNKRLLGEGHLKEQLKIYSAGPNLE